MPYYPIADLASIGQPDSEGRSKVKFLTLETGDGGVFPVFTSVDRFQAFIDRYFAEDDSVRPSTFPMNPFRLAEMIGPLGRADTLASLAFDPLAASGGRWKSVAKPMPVAHYCRFISELRPGAEELARESAAQVGAPLPAESEAYADFMEWFMPRIKRLADNAGAQVEEWWDRHSADDTSAVHDRGTIDLSDEAATEASTAARPVSGTQSQAESNTVRTAKCSRGW